MKNYKGIIMAGGSGTRFWPYSTPQTPKQFLDILGIGKTLLQQAYERLESVCGQDNILIVSNARYKSLIEAQLPHLPVENTLYEPLKKNTAPCLSLCAHYLSSLHPDCTVIVIPADHVISNETEFRRLAGLALNEGSKAEKVLTFGIKADKPHTGYGYIETLHGDGDLLEGISFHEKPDIATAEKYLESGNYYWNSGMFVWNNRLFLKLLEQFAPDIHKPFAHLKSVDFFNETMLTSAYTEMTDISIDHALMEKLSDFVVIKSDLGWSDIGSWGALENHLPSDENGNCFPHGVKLIGDARNCIFFSDEKITFMASDLSDMIIVQTRFGVLVCPKNQEQGIKKWMEHI